MDQDIYHLRYQVDLTEWRARTRRDLVYQLINQYLPGTCKKFKLLDFGCGTGVLQDELERKFSGTSAFGIDSSPTAVRYGKRRGLKRIKVFDGKKIPFGNNSFDVVTAIDVLEHIDDDLAALGEIHRVLKRSGILVAISPAHQFLWSTRDQRLGHFRRYNRGVLEKRIQKAHFQLLTQKNVGWALFFILWAACLVKPKQDVAPHIQMDVSQLHKIPNEIVYWYESWENLVQKITTFPVGVSVAVVAQKL